jgi:single-strand DNA-binding protein
VAGEPEITVVGDLVDEPELRFTPSGAAVCNFRIASTPRRFNDETNQWEDGETLWLGCSVWRDAAENVVQSLTKGHSIIVHGRLRQRLYETREGDKTVGLEIDVENVGPDLRHATAKVSAAPTPRRATS